MDRIESRRCLIEGIEDLESYRKWARDLYRKAIAANPKSTLAYNNLAHLVEPYAVDLPGALALAKKAVETNPNLALANDTLAWMYYRNRKNRDALRHSQAALALGGDVPTYHYHLGLIQDRLGKGSAAIRSWQRAVEISDLLPDVPFPHRKRAEALLREKG